MHINLVPHRRVCTTYFTIYDKATLCCKQIGHTTNVIKGDLDIYLIFYHLIINFSQAQKVDQQESGNLFHQKSFN